MLWASGWTVPREWEGETAFIIAGGPSVLTQNLGLLRGRKVIVINSSCYRVPWANILYFGDGRWWRENKKAIADFVGRVVTVAAIPEDGKILQLEKKEPPGLSNDPRYLMQRRTSLTAATNLAVLLGAKQVIWLGADGKQLDGRTHHHAPHKWPQKPDCWKEQRKDLVGIVSQLTALGVELLNVSPGSAWDFVPIVTLEDVLQKDELLVA